MSDHIVERLRSVCGECGRTIAHVGVTRQTRLTPHRCKGGVLSHTGRPGSEVTAEAFISACQARGVDTTDVRYAAHEAHHALSCGAKDWSNEGISRAVSRLRRGDRLTDEIMARAVEQIVCRRLGVATKGVEHWAFVSCMESLKYDRLDIGGPDRVAEMIRGAMATQRAEAAAAAVLAIVVAPRR